ncbi:cell adhesion molecule L1-like a isoform 2-T4 [Polymixia lowei]
MRSPWRLGLILLLALTSKTTSLNIPLEVEQPPTITTHTSSPVIALPFDNSFTMRCEAKGNPPPEYRWTKDGKDFTPPHVSKIKTEHSGSFVLQKSHLAKFQGRYRCYASNRLGTAMTKEIQLIVPSSPKFPKEMIEPIVVEEGQPVILRCNPPEGVPPRQLYWMSIGLQHIDQDERVSMGTDGNLYFSNAMEKDNRQDYCCFASFSKIRTIVQKTAMSVVVKTLKPDSDVEDSGNKTVSPPVRRPSLLLPSGVQTEVVLVKGRELQLECIAEGFPTPKMEWLKMGEKLPERTNIKNYGKLLTIPAVEEKDAGKYMCKAKNSVGEAVHYIDVIVEDPPKWITEPPQNQLAVIGSEVHIKCLAEGKPQPTITWRRNGLVLEDDSSTHRRVLDDVVVLRDARSEDSAVYQCEASNRHAVLLANVNVMVTNMAPLVLTRDRQRYPVVHGGNVTMNCSVFGSPLPSISWAKDETSKTIEGERFSVLQNGSLRIISAEKEDSGDYLCFAINTEGKSVVIAAVDVKDSTRIVRPPQDLRIISGTTAQLMCQAEYDKTLETSFEVVWLKDREEIPLASTEQSRYSTDGGKLQIMNVNKSDQGVYTCTARTNLDKDTASAVLTVLDVPDAPENVKMSELKKRSVRLSWVPGSDHNSSTTEFIVEYEESQWEPGKWKELLKVPGNQATAELSLHGHLNYQFRVYAVNAVGPGPPSEPTDRHRTLPAAPDRNPENIKIQGHLPHQMDISWEPLLPVEHNGPGLEYKVSYRRLGLEDVWKEQLVKRHLLVVKNTPTFVPYEIKIQSRNSHGWGPEPKIVTGYSGEDVPTAAPQDVAVEVINTTLLRVSWTQVPAATVRGHLGGYNVHWSRKRSLLNPDKIPDERHSLPFPGNRSHAMVPGLKPFSEYRLTVNVYNKKGNGPNSDPVTFHTPQGVPDPVPILTASNAQKDSISLVWGPPVEANGILTGYLLQYQLVNETTLEVGDPLEVNVSGAAVTQWLLQGLKEDSLYRFSLGACTRAGCGRPVAQEGRTLSVTRHNSSLSFPSSIPDRATQPPLDLASVKSDSVSTQGWFIGTMCAVALLTLAVLIACFVQRNKGGKYAVKEKEDLRHDVESRGMNDDTFCEYSDEKPLKAGSFCSLNGDDMAGDSVSRDSLVEYADGEVEFNEDGSFIGEYSGPKRRRSSGETNGPGPVTA